MKTCYDIRGFAPKDQLYGNSLYSINREHRNIRLVDPAQDDGTRIWPHSFDVGRPVDPATMPKFLARIGPKEHALLDLYSFGNDVVVPEAFKQIVEELEPGVHQFFKMQIVEEDDKSLKPIGERYFMVACNRLATLHDTLCEPALVDGWPERQSQTKLIFSNQKIDQAHVWIDKKLSQTLFISEALHARLVALNMSGVQFTPFEVAD